MEAPAVSEFRVERDSGTEPMKNQRLGARAIGTALTGVPMPSSKPTFASTLRILDSTNTVVFEKFGDHRMIDALELEILSDLMKLDVDAFRAAYGLAGPSDG
jgi:hypothetical protein